MSPCRDESASIGESADRVDGKRFVTGEATYANDVSLPGQLSLAPVRSPHAHARIESVDTTAAESMAGVRDVVTGAELAATTNPIPTETMGEDGDGQYGLATDRLQYDGELIAAVAATSKYLARDAADRIAVE